MRIDASNLAVFIGDRRVNASTISLSDANPSLIFVDVDGERLWADRLLIIAAPPCHCVLPTPWNDRRYDGVWPPTDPDDGPLESRTCLTCGASKSIEIPRPAR